MYRIIKKSRAKLTGRLDQRGDTIIEVMLVLAILSLAFGISFATANKGLSKSLNAEQHSEALGIIDSQIEELRTAIASSNFNITSGQYFCMTSATQAIQLPGAFVPNQQTDLSQGYGEYGQGSNSCTDSTIYHVTIKAASPATSGGQAYTYTTPVPCSTGSSCDENSYTFVVRWAGNGNLGPQQEALTYRIGSLVAGTGDYASGDTIVPSGGSPSPNSQTVDGGAGSCYNPNNDVWYCISGSANIAGTTYNTIASYRASSISGGSTTSGSYDFIMTYNTSLFGLVSPQTDPNGYSLYINYTNIANGGMLPPGSSYYSYDVTISDSNCTIVRRARHPVCDSVSAQLAPPSGNQVDVESSAIDFTQLTDLASEGPLTIDWSNDYCCSDPNNGSQVDANFQINNIEMVPN